MINVKVNEKIQQEIDSKNFYNNFTNCYFNMLQGAQLKAKILVENESYPIGTKILLLHNGIGRVYAEKYRNEFYSDGFYTVNLTFIRYDGKRNVRKEVCDCDVKDIIDEVQNK